ncbi:MAG: malto-oligosyltrehalose synthase, partial [Nostoc sp.]
EKILELTEDLPENWEIEGTSGYDFLNYVNGVFCQTENQSQFDKIYQNFIGSRVDYSTIVKEKKHLILEKNLAGDIDNLALLLKNVSSKYRYGNDFTLNGLKRAIAEVLTLFPIYRTYITPDGIGESDRATIQEVIRQAKEQTPLLH